MPHIYLATYVGVGSDEDPFRPRGSEQDGWSAIDLRRDPTVATGRALLSVPVRDDTIGTYLGDTPDEVSATIKSAIESRLGITLDVPRLRHIIPELLIAHAREDGTRWKPLRAMHDGVFRVYLGGLFWEARSLSGGSTITESFNTADSGTLGPDLTWTAMRNGCSVLSNMMGPTSTGLFSIERADSALASSNHYARITVVTLVSGTVNVIGTAVRCSTTEITCYMCDAVYNSSSQVYRPRKAINNSFTAFGDITVTFSLPEILRTQIDGSTLKAFQSGVERVNVTDTGITGLVRAGVTAQANTAVAQAAGDSFEAGDLVKAKARITAFGFTDASPSLERAVRIGGGSMR